MVELEDIDRRSALFVGLTPENLARHVDGFARTASTPRRVAGLLAEARRTFVGASVCYDNFASAALKALQAAEVALRVKTQTPAASRATLGKLVWSEDTVAVLTASQLEWFRKFALHFRNRLAHPTEPIAMTPGFAEPFLRTAHEVIAEMFPDCERRAPSTNVMVQPGGVDDRPAARQEQPLQERRCSPSGPTSREPLGRPLYRQQPTRDRAAGLAAAG